MSVLSNVQTLQHSLIVVQNGLCLKYLLTKGLYLAVLAIKMFFLGKYVTALKVVRL
jgi:hypothetical protein